MEISDPSSLVGALSGVFVVLGFVLYMLVVAFFIVGCIIFEKADIKSWKNLIPYYRTYLLFKIAGLGQGICIVAASLSALQTCLLILPGMKSVVSIVSIAIFVFNIPLCINMSKRFGHSGLFAVGLFFLPFIFYPILAFGKSEYTAP